MKLYFYNTLGRKKQEFKPIKDEIGFYACGPTVYHYAHLGNLRSYVFMDILRKTLEYNNYDVNLVMNITDVGHLTDDADEGEDKMEKGARREGKSVWDIAKHYEEAFLEDIKNLNIEKPSTICRATEHIEEQINLIKEIEKNSFTYTTSDGVYFDTSKLDDYGKLVPNFNAEELEVGKRISLGEKKNSTDFALWKFSPEKEQRQMEWDSPWGKGFPGWHIECTAMACKYLGNKFDIHTGGIDHIPVHHTNEIAQAQGAYGEEHVNYWLHNEFLKVESGKMAKSEGNFLRMQTIYDKGYSALDYRYMCLLTHYRKQLNFTWDALEAAANARKKINNKVLELKEKNKETGKVLEKYKDEFQEHINNDLNTPKAISTLQELIDSKEEAKNILATTYELDKVLGLGLINVEKEKIPEDVKLLAEHRELARKNKEFKEADRLRDKIKGKGFKVKDKKDGFEIERI